MVSWWIWAIVSLVLFVSEIIAAGSFFIFFFALAALAVAGLAFFGILTETPEQLTLFATLSVILMIVFRTKLLALLSSGADQSKSLDIIGEEGVVSENIGIADKGKVELRGTVWNAKNISKKELRKGMPCRVVALDGLVLHIEPLTQEKSI